MTRIGVIGAGITGVTTAYALSERGYDVTVFDQHRYAAMETSFANGGQLSASNAEVWNKASTVWQGMRWMLRRDAPLLMNPKPSWHKYSWMAEFVRNIPNYRKNTLETVRLAIEARRHMFAMAERENIDFDLQALWNPSFLPRQGQLRQGVEGEQASDRRRPRAATGDARGDPSDRAHVEGVVLRRLLHAVGLDGRHPQVHARPRRRLRPPWRAFLLRRRGREASSQGRRLRDPLAARGARRYEDELRRTSGVRSRSMGS